MTFLKYLKDHFFLIVTWCIATLIFDLVIFLDPHNNLSSSTYIYATFLSVLILLIYIYISYISKLSWFNNLRELSHDNSFKLSTPKSEADKYEAHILEQITSDFRQKVTDLNIAHMDQKEFIESWVHDIKVPLAAVKLILEKNDIFAIKDNTNLELTNINHLVEQILYYSRLTDFSNDYLIKEYNLKNIVNMSIKNNLSLFINKDIKISLNNLDFTILTDEKWLLFILNQILSNSLKYTKEHGEIKIWAEYQINSTKLIISDNGIGINPNDLPRIFDKGYTGSNGRQSGSKATGLGLYLAKKMSLKLGQDIFVTSELSKGTKTEIIFPELSYFKQ